MSKPKILLLDLETLPNICYAYDLYSPKSAKMIIKEKCIITFAYKWLGDKTVTGVTSDEFQPKSKPFNPYYDAGICSYISKIIAEADYVVAHYGDKFDLRFIRARSLINGLEAPPIVPSIDTYKLAKKHFYFNANRLDYLGELLGFGGKIKTDFSLWKRCAEGDKAAIKEMSTYNKRDVDLLEKVFNFMLPHCETKLNHKLFSEKSCMVCPHCGSSHIEKRGTLVTKLAKRQRYQCQDCASWFSGKL